MSRKHDLKVVSIEKTTPSSVEISLEKMPDHNFTAGQYISLELSINGEQVNRSYSFSSAPYEDTWKIGVKEVPGGKASTFLNNNLIIGDSISCLEPMGNFVIPECRSSQTHFLFIAAGSGITPVYSMIKSLLKNENAGKITLCYGNKNPEETMFIEELKSLSENNSNFNLELIFSQSGGNDAFHSGRINFGKTLELMAVHPFSGASKHAFICGPGDMITSVTNALSDNGYSKDEIHTEFFTAPTSEESTSTETSVDDTNSAPYSGTSKIKVTLDDEDHEITLADGGKVILDAALDAGMDAPFSCKGGVCTACRAKVTKGKVEMISNFALTDGELADGYVLTCQSHPKSNVIELSYDE